MPRAKWLANSVTVAGKATESIVLFGVGPLGRRTAIGLRTQGIEPLAFVDNNSKLWQTP